MSEARRRCLVVGDARKQTIDLSRIVRGAGRQRPIDARETGPGDNFVSIAAMRVVAIETLA